MNDSRGSLWRKWDLHVHTPASLYHNYGAGDDVWEKFVASLEQLPQEFSVIGINDYLFLDGYRKILEFKSQGRLSNIDTFLPVVEFRIARFAGTENKLRRINYHVIFSNEVTSDQIEQQFLNRLSASYKLAPEVGHEWSGVVTRESLEDLGRKIIDSAPPEKKADYGPPVIEGFNNLNLSLEDILNALDSTYFRNNYLTAIGKTEWASLKWNDQSVAEKKTLINAADAVFISAASADAYKNARGTLQTQNVNDRLLDCSDAHGWPDPSNKDSLGHCELWMKADPTFRGLQHALLEFDERVYVGSEPPKVSDVKRRPQRYLRSVTLAKTPDSTLSETWFDSHIDFNPGLVAVIGNKGSGKSALADIVALGGNSQQEASFSFLNQDKFRNARDNKSLHFEATLTWQDSEQVQYKLSESPDSEDVERIRYIPQSYLESLCNEFATEGGGAFDLELRAVIFSHIPSAERLRKQNLDDLINYLGEETYDRINALKGELSKANREIAALEEAASPERKREVEKRRTARLKELATLKSSEPASVAKPTTDEATQKAATTLQSKIKEQRKIAADLEAQVAKTQEERKTLLTKIATADKLLQRVRNLEESYRQMERDSADDLDILDIAWTDLAKLSTSTTPLKNLHAKCTEKEAEARHQLDPENPDGFVSRLDAAKKTVTDLQNQLDAPTRKHQEYLTAHEEWKANVARMESDTDDPDSITSLNAELKRISEIPSQIAILETERSRVCGLIFDQISGLKEQYRKLYKPVQDFIHQQRTSWPKSR